jgi:pimeloyl-ACP methyl ester carboxylesterase
MDPARERELLERFDAPPEGRFAAINDVEMYYEVHGTGEPLLLLHGFFRTGGFWKPYLRFFAGHFQVITPDLRGHGRSTNPLDEFTHRQSALDIAALLDQLGIERFRAAGFSSGGMTLLHLATRQPERPEALILAAATSYFSEQTRAIQRQMDPALVTDEMIREMGVIHRRGEAQARALRGQFHEFKDSYEDMNFTPPLLSTIQASTLIVHGDRDEFFEAGIPLEMYRAIPNSYLWIMPNTDHAVFRNQIDLIPEAFQRITLAFLRGEWEETPDGSSASSD